MTAFFIAIALLVVGYGGYAYLTEWAFGPDSRPTPAWDVADNVDYIGMPAWKAFLVQLLNTAGLSPIFGALMGAVFGPVVFFWIAAGTILGGAVHDYMTGMISCRMGGACLPEIVGAYMGNGMKQLIRALSLLLLVLFGTVFVSSPASLLAMLGPKTLDADFWTWVILGYYVLAVLLPLDKVIGVLYPVFGVFLMLMAVGVGGGIFINGFVIPELTIQNLYPDGGIPWPYIYAAVGCAAASGFHGAQSPLIARCLRNEWEGREVFYGAMCIQGILALIWAAAGAAFYGSAGPLIQAVSKMGQSGVIYDITTSLLGSAGGALAVIGVAVCPVASGSMAFRSARMILADCFCLDQSSAKMRLLLAAPLLSAGLCLSQLDKKIVWGCFWGLNQSVAAIGLWTAAVYLNRRNRKRAALVAAVPAGLMSAVSAAGILTARTGFHMDMAAACPAGLLFAAVCGIVFWRKTSS